MLKFSFIGSESMIHDHVQGFFDDYEIDEILEVSDIYNPAEPLTSVEITAKALNQHNVICVVAGHNWIEKAPKRALRTHTVLIRLIHLKNGMVS